MRRMFGVSYQNLPGRKNDSSRDDNNVALSTIEFICSSSHWCLLNNRIFLGCEDATAPGAKLESSLGSLDAVLGTPSFDGSSMVDGSGLVSDCRPGSKISKSGT